MNDRIEKRIELKAPISRVWRALTDHREFGESFRVKLDGPFVPGQVSRGQITYPGCEHIKWEAVVQKMEHERLFSFTWPHPKSLDKADCPLDYSGELPRSSSSGWRRFRKVHCFCLQSPASIGSPAIAASKHSAEMTGAGQSK
jgi:uncharacterized protein YndB with AHSA1/START domain